MRQAAVGILGLYLVSTVGLVPQSEAAVVMTLVGGILCIAFALVSPIYPKALNTAALIGFLLACSAFLAIDSDFVDGNRGTVGIFMMACAVAPRVRRLAPGESAHKPARTGAFVSAAVPESVRVAVPVR